MAGIYTNNSAVEANYKTLCKYLNMHMYRIHALHKLSVVIVFLMPWVLVSLGMISL